MKGNSLSTECCRQWNSKGHSLWLLHAQDKSSKSCNWGQTQTLRLQWVPTLPKMGVGTTLISPVLSAHTFTPTEATALTLLPQTPLGFQCVITFNSKNKVLSKATFKEGRVVTSVLQWGSRGLKPLRDLPREVLPAMVAFVFLLWEMPETRLAVSVILVCGGLAPLFLENGNKNK